MNDLNDSWEPHHSNKRTGLIPLKFNVFVCSWTALTSNCARWMPTERDIRLNQPKEGLIFMTDSLSAQVRQLLLSYRSLVLTQRSCNLPGYFVVH